MPIMRCILAISAVGDEALSVGRLIQGGLQAKLHRPHCPLPETIAPILVWMDPRPTLRWKQEETHISYAVRQVAGSIIP